MEIRVLGAVEAWRDGREVGVGGGRERALLAILALRAGQVVARDTLIDELWAGAPPPSAAHSLDAYVSRLRKALGQGVLERRPPGYRLLVDDTDVAHFERLADRGRIELAAGDPAAAAATYRSALGLWRGPALAGLDDQPFARAEARRLEELRLAATEARLDAELALGEAARVVPELQALVAQHPLREHLRGQLMLALYGAGRQAEALAVYREGRARLVADLGIEPGPELRAIERAILAHDPHVAPPPRAGNANGRPRRGARTALFAAVGVAVAIAAGGWFALRGDETAAAPARGNALVLVRDGKVDGAVPLRAAPQRVVAYAGSLWVAYADGQAVARVDPDKRVVTQTIEVGHGPTAFATADDALWVVNHLDGTLSRIDPGTQQVVQTVRIGTDPTDVAVAAGALWVAHARGLSRVDPRTGAVTERVSLDTPVTAVAAAAGALWAVGGSGVARVDPRSGRVVDTITIGGGPDAIVAGAGGLWVANALDGTVSRLDPARDTVTATISVGGEPAGLALDATTLRVADGHRGGVTEIDTERAAVRRVVTAGEHATAVAGQWVGVRGGGSAHRGGTLTLLFSATAFDSIDPALLYSVQPAQLLGLTNDGLMTFEHVGGRNGTRLVPDLAQAIPAPSRDGRTYTFRLRRGIRYSDGVPLRASDFRRALERLFTAGSPGSGFYTGILGAVRCGAKVCDLAQGIETDDDAGTVTLHLTKPDPELLYKLALPFAFAVPPGTPPRDVGQHPIPATGPYRIASYDRRELVLTRNQRFREWSHAAQPDGYPDRIVWRLRVDIDHALDAIASNAADWIWSLGTLPEARRRELERRNPGQLHVNPVAATSYYILNVHEPPFDDVRVRRALNLALDRRALVRLSGGAEAATPTCQILPPQLPGFRRYCPYPRDLAKARALVAASGTRGTRVVLWQTPEAEFVPLDAVILHTLRLLGFHAAKQIVSSEAFVRDTGNSDNHVQLSSGIWYADYPAASNFIELKLSCARFTPSTDYQDNAGGFCDRAIDREIGRALALQVQTPAQADELWARIDHELTDQAPWLATVNPATTDFVSRRVGNYQYHPLWGPLVDQMWVR